MASMDPSRYGEFDRLIKRHKHFVKAYCLRYSGCEENLCVELVQACYIVMWKRLPKLPLQPTLAQEHIWMYWCCRIAVSRFFRRKPDITTLPIDQHLADVVAAPDNSEAREQIEDLAQYLAPRERQVFLLTANGYEVKSIAKMLGIKPESVSQCLYRAIMKLRDIVNSDNYEK